MYILMYGHGCLSSEGCSYLRKQLLGLLKTMLDSHLDLTSEYKCNLQFTTEAAFSRSKETL